MLILFFTTLVSASSEVLKVNSSEINDILNTLNDIQDINEAQLISILKTIDWADPLILKTLFDNQNFLSIIKESSDKNKIFTEIKAFDLKIVFNKGQFVKNTVLQEFGKFIFTNLNSLNEFISFSLDFNCFCNHSHFFKNDTFVILILNKIQKFLDSNSGALEILHLDNLNLLFQMGTLQLQTSYSYPMSTFTIIKTIKNLSNLKELSLVHPFSWGMYSRSYVHLSDNFFEKLTELRKLNLSCNFLAAENLFPNLNVLKKLEELDLSDTKLGENTPPLDLPSLKILNLSHALRRGEVNNFSENFFKKLPKLTVLILIKNDLTSLPIDLELRISTLEVLDISENQLPSLPEYIYKKGVRLRELYFDSNYCYVHHNFELPLDFLKGLTNLEYCTIPYKIPLQQYINKYPHIKFQERNKHPSYIYQTIIPLMHTI